MRRYFGYNGSFLMKLMAAHLNVKQKRVHGRAFLISFSSESSPVVGKPSFSASLFSTPSLDLCQVESCSKTVKCWNGSSCDPKESFGI